ncbi:MAG: RipA family octameric membrane protein [Caulobacterales bacterium]
MSVDRTFEVYKILVEEVREARRARRDLANVFTTMNLGGVGALGFLASPTAGQSLGLLAWACVALVLVCLVWRISNAYYSALLAAKYTLIYEIEEAIGLDYLQREWKLLPRGALVKFFSLERLMPILFIVGYLIFLAYQIPPDKAAGFAHDAVARVDAFVAAFTQR